MNSNYKPTDPKVAFFPVELRPLYMAGKQPQQYTQLKRHFAVVDVENDSAFSVVTDQYKLISNADAYELAESVMGRVFGSIKRDDMECFNITMPVSRSFCHIDLIRKGSSFHPWEQDSWTAFLRISNSYNKTRKLKFEIGFCRWLCMNGMIFGSKSVDISYSHMKRNTEQIEKFAENIGDIRKMELELVEGLKHLRRYYVPEEEMLPIACKAFGIRTDAASLKNKKRSGDLFKFRQAVSRATREYFGELGPQGYSALNVLTDYATRPEGVLSRESSIDGLQKKAGDWSNTICKCDQQSVFFV
jgi:hypothetical protein